MARLSYLVELDVGEEPGQLDRRQHFAPAVLVVVTHATSVVATRCHPYERRRAVALGI